MIGLLNLFGPVLYPSYTIILNIRIKIFFKIPIKILVFLIYFKINTLDYTKKIIPALDFD